MRIIDQNSIAWREAHRRVLVEPDQPKLLKHVYATEEALFHRWQELCLSDDHAVELHEMNLACEDLLRIKTEELGWPPVRLPDFDALWAAANEGALKAVPKTDRTEFLYHGE